VESISAKDVSPYCRALARQFSDGQVSWESLVPLIRRQSSDGQQDLVNVQLGAHPGSTGNCSSPGECSLGSRMYSFFSAWFECAGRVRYGACPV